MKQTPFSLLHTYGGSGRAAERVGVMHGPGHRRLRRRDHLRRHAERVYIRGEIYYVAIARYIAAVGKLSHMKITSS